MYRDYKALNARPVGQPCRCVGKVTKPYIMYVVVAAITLLNSII